jgi:hypothetical protein
VFRFQSISPEPWIIHKIRNHAIVINLGGNGIHLVHAVMLSDLGDRLDLGSYSNFLEPRLTPGVFGEAALNQGGVEIYERPIDTVGDVEYFHWSLVVSGTNEE